MTEKNEPRRVVIIAHPDPEKAKTGETVKGLILDFETVKEEWGVYKLEDGTRVKIKIHPAQFNKALDPKTDQVLYKNGQPMYGLQAGVEVVYEPTEAVLKP